MPREQSIVDRVRNIVDRNGGHVIKTHGSSLRSGEPDLIGTWQFPDSFGLIGIKICIETKQPGEKPTAIQYERLRFWNSKGAIAIWTSDPNEIVAIINKEIEARIRGYTTLGNDSRPEKENLHGKYAQVSKTIRN